MREVQATCVRNLVPNDNVALAKLFREVGLFEPSELVELDALVREYFAGKLNDDHHWLVRDTGTLVGAAYFALDTSPDRMAPGTWNLYFIGVLPGHQGSGHGSALIRHVESALAADGASELLVETSGVESFEATRTFYRKHGYRVIARVVDAYKAGDDKVIFSKRLGRG